MLNKAERMEKLNAMGVDTGKYFTVNLPDGLAKNSTITLTINENGEYTVVNANAVAVNVGAVESDPILESIIQDGYVRNSKLHRRFVMAQMFAALNYVSYDGKYSGYNECIKRRYGYKYTIDMMTEEVRVLSKLEERDRETLEERAHFFNKSVIAATLKHHLDEVKNYVDKLPSKNCKGVPYKRVKGDNIFVADLQKKVYSPIERYIGRVERAKSYKEIYRILCEFKRNMIALPYNTPKSKAWFDAYKGSGAYYTMRNLLAFHHCFVEDNKGNKLYGPSAVKFVEGKVTEYHNEGWRMFAMMKKLITDNGINTKTHIREICNK
jgi:hypothetical protein